MFSMTDIITKKKNGEKLSEQQIRDLIDGYVNGDVPDYQMSALLMAIYFNGMDEDEIYILTDAMKNSGEVIDLTDIKGNKVDKHSSGGVGDKLSLTACPVAAAAGVKIAKMSGRGLGFTGGTIDKLESVPGFRTDIPMDEFKANVNEIGLSIISQSEEIAKADKMIYALRDVTSTVDVPALIASSIMSKKLAMGSDAVLLDVKYGDGALMKTKKDAENLAKLMIMIGEKNGKRTDALISDMDQPLGNCVGNSLEIAEAIKTLKGNGPEDMYKSTVEMAGRMIYLGGIAETVAEGERIAEEMISSGRAFEKFREFIIRQGGDVSVIDDISLLPVGAVKREIKGRDVGITEKSQIRHISALAVGTASQICGAGRTKKGEKVDPGAGILLSKKAGDTVEPDDAIALLYASDEDKAQEAIYKLTNCWDYIKIK